MPALSIAHQQKNWNRRSQVIAEFVGKEKDPQLKR